MDIRLKTLHMENFKCHRNLTLEFGGGNCSIYGDNATGKTSVYDGLTWLLFGKDSLGNGEKNMEIKPLSEDGSVTDHTAITEVEAVFLANCEEVTLKRTYQEVWSTKRGSLEATYDGNTSEYFVDGVPVKANAFKAKVNELVDEDRFRMLTNVSWFAAGIPWQKRREVLFDLFGVMDDRQIMETDSRFNPLMEAMGKHSLEDFRKMMAQEKKNCTGIRNEVPARISECEKTIADLQSTDFDAGEIQLAAMGKDLERLNRELLEIEQNTAIQKKQVELREAQLELDKLDADNRQFRAKQKADATPGINVTARFASIPARLETMRRRMSYLENSITNYERYIAGCRDRWKQANAMTFTAGNCPTCGQALPADQAAKAKAEFEADRKTRMETAVEDGDRYKTMKRDAEEELQTLQQEAEVLKKEQAELQAQIEEAKNIHVLDMEGYDQRKASIEVWIRHVRQELEAMQTDSSKAAAGVRMAIADLKRKMAELRAVVGMRSAYDYAKERIAQLRMEAKDAAEKLARTEQMLWLMEEYSRYKASFVEGGINDHFDLARFRLFREQANGGIEDRCDVTFDGVPYTGLNNGMKINVGIDIINALSRCYGVRVPLFVDNAESVTRLENGISQVIRLVVSENDKELRLEHEN